MWLPCINSSELYQFKLSAAAEEVTIKVNSQEIKLINNEIS